MKFGDLRLVIGEGRRGRDDEEESGVADRLRDSGELPPERGLFAVGAFEGQKLVVKGVGRADFLALGALVQGVCMPHSRQSLELHG